MKFTNRIQRVEVSLTIGMAKKAREMRAEGKDVISLSLGEPDFDTPDHIKQAAIEAIQAGKTKYPPVGGIPELKNAIIQKFKRENGLVYDAKQVMVSTGAKQCIMNAILALVQEGDEVLIPLPYWVSYSEMVRFAGGTPVFIPSDPSKGFRIDTDALREKVSERSRVIIFSSPSNPAGSVIEKEELRAIADIALDNPDLTIISDEIYEHIVFDGEFQSISQFPEIHPQLLVVNGVSKGFAMTGWRIGYMAGPQEIIAACEKLQGQFTSGANSIAQWAAVAALEQDLRPTKEMVEIFRTRRDLMIDLVREVPGFEVTLPAGAFYLFPDVSHWYGKEINGVHIASGMDLCLYLLEHAMVSLVPGVAFGMPDHIRISYAASENELREAMNRIKKALTP